MKIHILATCNDPEIAGGTSLVFDTLRVGFPHDEVTIHVNKGCVTHCPNIVHLCKREHCAMVDVDTLHHFWIEKLVQTEKEPFFILDTDVIFWKQFTLDNVEHPIVGHLIPKFHDEFTKAMTMPRIHTSLMRIDPVAVLSALAMCRKHFNQTRFNPMINPFYPVQIPVISKAIFYDTCSLLYHAIGGQPFTDEQLDCYDHLNAGTWVKELSAAYPNMPMIAAHKAIYENHNLAKGIRKIQNAFYASHSSS